LQIVYTLAGASYLFCKVCCLFADCARRDKMVGRANRMLVLNAQKHSGRLVPPRKLLAPTAKSPLPKFRTWFAPFTALQTSPSSSQEGEEGG
jgi:hypothetical protein